MNRNIMQYRQTLSLIVALFFLSSCGFSSIYKKENNSTYEVLATIEIAPINSIEGADFYNHLKNIFPYNVASTNYLLTAELSFHKEISVSNVLLGVCKSGNPSNRSHNSSNYHMAYQTNG
jgi:hypothetical protein